MKNKYVLIMAGGEGTRFYPLSTPECPKQFLNFIGEKSFIRQTFERILPLIRPENAYVSTNEKYVNLVKGELPEIPEGNIIAEPAKKNTAPALAFAMYLISKRDPDAIVCCLPCDHHIADEDGFRNAMEKAFNLAKQNFLVTLGVMPDRPSTEYGYIRPKNAGLWSEVAEFIEKPEKAVATRLIEDGCLWNAGIFVWKADCFFTELTKHAPQIAEHVQEKEGRLFHPADFFKKAPSISIDHALMECSDRVAVIPVAMGWSDVGNWETISRLIEDGVDVAPRVRAVMKGNNNAPWRRIIPKPWGHEELWALTDQYAGKTLFVKKGKRLSLQYHERKTETLRLLSGHLNIELKDGLVQEMQPGDVFHVPAGTLHRLAAIDDSVVLEVSTSELDDVVRLQDDHGRVATLKVN